MVVAAGCPPTMPSKPLWLSPGGMMRCVTLLRMDMERAAKSLHVTAALASSSRDRRARMSCLMSFGNRSQGE